MTTMNPKTIITRMLGVALALALLGSGLAQQAAAPDHVSEIDAIVAAEMQKQTIPATTVAVAYGGQVIYSKGFGKADIENGVPATAETLIRTRAIAKPISAA